MYQLEAAVIREPEEKQDLAHLFEYMLFQGTKQKDARALNEAFESLGVRKGASTGGEIEGDEGFAEVGVAVEEGEFATEDTFVPEPVELEFLDVGEGGTGFGCWRSRLSSPVGGWTRFFIKSHRIWCPFKMALMCHDAW